MESDEIRFVFQNVSFLFFGTFLMAVGAIAISVLSFSQELKTMYKEHANGWYSVGESVELVL